MTEFEKKVSVRVPATSANLGPGFDSFGCAFTLYNTFTFEITGLGLSFSGVPDKYANADNLSYRGYAAAMKKMGLSPEDGLKITIDSEIPICRGLGSSAALLVAGGVAANELHGRLLSNMDIIEVCTEIEGHPDNIAPALTGGLTASMMDEGKPYTVKYNVSPEIRPVVIIPDFELSTEAARSVLPASVPFADAVHNIGHSAILLRALETGDAEMISHALSDKLHQPYRKSLISGYEEARSAALGLGAISYCISGAGPTQLALITGDSLDFADRLSEKIHASLPGWQVMELAVDNEGAKVIDF